MSELKKNYTVVIVTHNMQQAARISDRTAFFLLGELVEIGPHGSDLQHPAGQTDRGLYLGPLWLRLERGGTHEHPYTI